MINNNNNKIIIYLKLATRKLNKDFEDKNRENINCYKLEVTI